MMTNKVSFSERIEIQFKLILFLDTNFHKRYEIKFDKCSFGLVFLNSFYMIWLALKKSFGNLKKLFPLY